MSIAKSSAHFAPERSFDEAAFLAFLEKRTDEDGRWELIDGIPIQMPPATLRHLRIATNLERLLRRALEATESPFDARREAGLRHPSDPHFRPVADVAVIDPREEEDGGEDRFYDDCRLVAEVLSPSTEHYDFIWKRPRYAELASCDYILLVSQSEMKVRLWSRATGFEEEIIEAGGRLELPALGVSASIEDLYRGVALA